MHAAKNSNTTTAFAKKETGASEKGALVQTAHSSPAGNTPDFEVSAHSSIYILTPLTPAARDWAAEFLPEDAQRWAGGVCVEWRFIADIVEGARRDGLSVVIQ